VARRRHDVPRTGAALRQRPGSRLPDGPVPTVPAPQAALLHRQHRGAVRPPLRTSTLRLLYSSSSCLRSHLLCPSLPFYCCTAVNLIVYVIMSLFFWFSVSFISASFFYSSSSHLYILLAVQMSSAFHSSFGSSCLRCFYSSSSFLCDRTWYCLFNSVALFFYCMLFRVLFLDQGSSVIVVVTIVFFLHSSSSIYRRTLVRRCLSASPFCCRSPFFYCAFPTTFPRRI